MAEEIVKIIENVDRLFSEIVVNGESHVSQRYVAPPTVHIPSASQTQDENVNEESNMPQQHVTPSTRQTQGEDVHAVDLNNVLHNFSDPEADNNIRALQQGMVDEVLARSGADRILQTNIDTVSGDVSTLQGNMSTIQGNISTLQGDVSTLQGNVSTLQGKVSTIEGEIPSQASAQNQLADKNFVNSSIATNTANFLGTYTSMADIEAIQDPTNNDYVFLQTTDASGNNLFDRYKYNADQGEWLFEYELNNSSFTAEQWATINSGLTQSSVTQEINDIIATLPIPVKSTISSSQTLVVSRDTMYFVDTANVTLTLDFDSSNSVKAEVYAIANCTVTYYTAQGVSTLLSMLAGTRATFVCFNGWKFNGVYGAVWN